jgi:recyclin-1
MVGEIYIVDSPKELGQLVRDVSRYEGTLSADDLYEIGEFSLVKKREEGGNGGLIKLFFSCAVQRRADWKRIEKQVEKQLFGLKLADDCVVS